jgi:hypothetical protein
VTPQEKLNYAVLYALKHGCFFPVKMPKMGANQKRNVKALIKWGTMHYLHTAIAEFYREPSR